MADAGPSYRLESKKLQLQIKQQEAAIERAELDILEMQDKVERSLLNIEAANRAIDEMQGKLASLESEHGQVTKSDVAAAAKSLLEDNQ